MDQSHIPALFAVCRPLDRAGIDIVSTAMTSRSSHWNSCRAKGHAFVVDDDAFSLPVYTFGRLVSVGNRIANIVLDEVVIISIGIMDGIGTQAIDFHLGKVSLVLFAVLIVALAVRGKKDFINQLALARAAEAKQSESETYRPPMTLTETQLEITVIVAAIISLACGFLMGMEALALRVLLGIIEGFAFLFFIVFVVIRFLTTREVRPRALACLALTGVSLWYLITST